MATFTKHVGRNKHGSRLVVVFREIPGAEDHCLVVLSDSLMDMYHDQLIREVNSKEAQATVDLFEVLTRRTFGDGSQMLNSLHEKGLLKKYPVSEIEMQPMPNRIVPLSMVNDQIAGKSPTDPADVTPVVEGAKTAADIAADVNADDTGVSVDTESGLVKVDAAKVDPVVIGQAVGQTSEEATKVAAESKLLQARLLEEDAKKMREEAYALDPALKKGGRPKKTKETT